MLRVWRLNEVSILTSTTRYRPKISQTNFTKLTAHARSPSILVTELQSCESHFLKDTFSTTGSTKLHRNTDNTVRQIKNLFSCTKSFLFRLLREKKEAYVSFFSSFVVAKCYNRLPCHSWACCFCWLFYSLLALKRFRRNSHLYRKQILVWGYLWSKKDVMSFKSAPR